MEFERICEIGAYSVDYLAGDSDDLVIVFASVGHDPRRRPAPEFVGTAIGRGAGGAGRGSTGRGVTEQGATGQGATGQGSAGGNRRRALFIADDQRSWANARGFEAALCAALAEVDRRRPLGRVLAMGLSMGGFAALVAASLVPVDVVLAFSPQWSVLPAHMPAERRWAEWTAALSVAAVPEPPRWPVAPLAPLRVDARIYLFHGLIDDLDQARGFPLDPSVDQLIFAEQSHSSLVAHLKARGCLAGLVEAALAGDRRRLLRIAGSAGGRRRRAAL